MDDDDLAQVHFPLLYHFLNLSIDIFDLKYRLEKRVSNSSSRKAVALEVEEEVVQVDQQTNKSIFTLSEPFIIMRADCNTDNKKVISSPLL